MQDENTVCGYVPSVISPKAAVKRGRDVGHRELGALEAGREMFGLATKEMHRASYDNDADGEQFGQGEHILRSGCQVNAMAI